MSSEMIALVLISWLALICIVLLVRAALKHVRGQEPQADQEAPVFVSIEIHLEALFLEGVTMEHQMPDASASVAAEAGQKVMRFKIGTPHGFDGRIEWHTSDETLGHLVFEDERETSGWVVSHGLGGTCRFTARLDGSPGPGQYVITKGMVVTFIPDVSMTADVEIDVLMAPAALDPDPVADPGLEPPADPSPAADSPATDAPPSTPADAGGASTSQPS